MLHALFVTFYVHHFVKSQFDARSCNAQCELVFGGGGHLLSKLRSYWSPVMAEIPREVLLCYLPAYSLVLKMDVTFS